MKDILRRSLSFAAAVPFVFAVLFFGYLPPTFDAIIYTDNIVGEGVCNAFLGSETEAFAYLYEADAYFGSELKTLRMRDLRYDVNEITLYLYDVEEADILSFDIAVFGFTVLHHNRDGDKLVFRPAVSEAVASDEEPLAHIVLEDPERGIAVNFIKSAKFPAWVWIFYAIVVAFFSAILGVGLAYLFNWAPSLRPPFLGASAVMTALLAGAFFCGSFPYVNYIDFLLNYLLLFAASLLINALTLPWLGSVLTALFTLFWYAANHFVILFRSKPIMPADLKAVRTALEVIDGYSLTPTPRMLFGAAIVFLYVALVIASYRSGGLFRRNVPLKRNLTIRGACACAAVVIIALSTHNETFQNLNSFAWDPKILESFHREGIALTFIRSVLNSRVTVPEGYSREAVGAYLDEYQAEADAPPSGVQPTNIIMVMNEAFSDLRTVGLSDAVDVMPFIDSLQENTEEGSLYVSVYGGGTCNTEFEALTGSSLAFFGAGAYPYTENVTKPLFSLASYFRDAGYLTDAFHANDAQGWNRNRVYPNLGFERFRALNEYPPFDDETYLHGHPADIADYRFMRSADAEHQDESRFLFCVTMQNHSDYARWEDVEEAESVKENIPDFSTDTRVYLSLVKASDDALKELVETYRDSDEPTMIVFFGDHQPGLPIDARAEIYIRDGLTILDLFQSKFFIWTNYETQSNHDMKISANYLPYLILERGNFPLPPFARMLREVAEKYPVISSQGVIDADGNLYSGVAELADDPLIQKYQRIQYANLFDELDPAWFAVP